MWYYLIALEMACSSHLTLLYYLNRWTLVETKGPSPVSWPVLEPLFMPLVKGDRWPHVLLGYYFTSSSGCFLSVGSWIILDCPPRHCIASSVHWVNRWSLSSNWRQVLGGERPKVGELQTRVKTWSEFIGFLKFSLLSKFWIISWLLSVGKLEWHWFLLLINT